MKLEILREAEAELNEAIAHYEDIESGLGIRYKEEVRKTLVWIQQNPEVPRPRSKGYRRVNLKIFRYYVAYHIHADTIWVLAIAHGYRRPEYWVERKQSIG